MKKGLKRTISYKGYTIRPYRFVKNLRFCEILDPNGEYWDETEECFGSTADAIRKARQMIDESEEESQWARW